MVKTAATGVLPDYRGQGREAGSDRDSDAGRGGEW
jgi:hypothetical protein